MKIIVDRIEEDKAVVELESGEMLTVDKRLLDGANEGDAVLITVEKKDKEENSTHSIFEALRKKDE